MHHLGPVALTKSEKYSDIIKDVIIYTFNSVTRKIRNKEESIKKQITEIQNKLDALEERFAIGTI